MWVESNVRGQVDFNKILSSVYAMTCDSSRHSKLKLDSIIIDVFRLFYTWLSHWVATNTKQFYRHLCRVQIIPFMGGRPWRLTTNECANSTEQTTNCFDLLMRDAFPFLYDVLMTQAIHKSFIFLALNSMNQNWFSVADSRWQKKEKEKRGKIACQNFVYFSEIAKCEHISPMWPWPLAFCYMVRSVPLPSSHFVCSCVCVECNSHHLNI